MGGWAGVWVFGWVLGGRGEREIEVVRKDFSRTTNVASWIMFCDGDGGTAYVSSRAASAAFCRPCPRRPLLAVLCFSFVAPDLLLTRWRLPGDTRHELVCSDQPRIERMRPCIKQNTAGGGVKLHFNFGLKILTNSNLPSKIHSWVLACCSGWLGFCFAVLCRRHRTSPENLSSRGRTWTEPFVTLPDETWCFDASFQSTFNMSLILDIFHIYFQSM